MSKKTKQIILSVTNDLLTDQRIHKVTKTLSKAGFSPLLVGRKLKTSKQLAERNYPVKRFNLWFNRGPLFYANYNLRLFIFLLFKKSDILVANDLDTLPANYFAYKTKKMLGNKKLKLVYDSHELFTEVPELNNRKLVKKIWLFFEKLILPKIRNAYTVCESIANYYNKRYGIKMNVFFNFPVYDASIITEKNLNIELPHNKKVILYQGALNIGRGIEHVIKIMSEIEGAILVIAGKGDIEDELKKLVTERKLNERVIFTGAIPLEHLSTLTQKADLGLVLQEDLSLSYRYVLPNRLFDFIKARVPVLVSDLPELNKIISKKKIGLLINGFEPDQLTYKIKKLLYNQTLIAEIKNNLEKNSKRYSWENQEKRIIDFYQNLS